MEGGYHLFTSCYIPVLDISRVIYFLQLAIVPVQQVMSLGPGEAQQCAQGYKECS